MVEDFRRKNFIVAVFLDFKRVFEIVNRRTLLDKLNMAGVKGDALRWFDSYLQDRNQIVKYKNCCSECVGVTQGIILGPTLFIFYRVSK